MANAFAHRLGATTAVGGIALASEKDQPSATVKPLAAGGPAYLCGTLADNLEPALHPNHHQFFHGWAVAGAVGYAVYKTYRWEAKTTAQKCVRFASMVIELAAPI